MSLQLEEDKALEARVKAILVLQNSALGVWKAELLHKEQ